jgi:carbon-monoxide dehydrogenase small subunit
MKITLTVNGEEREADAHGPESLLFVLRERLGLLGAKDACLQGECGSCTVLLDGDPVCSCLVMAADAAGSEVQTVEGFGTEDELHPVQAAFVEHGAVQCGFCTPGFIVSAAHLLKHNPTPTTDEIREALAGNICRCTGYGAVLRAITALAGEERS